MAKQFVLGLGQEIITPPLGTLLYGYGRKRPASRVNDDLRVNVIAFGYDKPTALWISYDLCSVPVTVASRIKKLIFDATGILENSIITCAIHTHSGPAISTTPGWGVSDFEYIENTFIPKTLGAVKAAIAATVPALLGVGTTDSTVGVNRRKVLQNGEVDLGQDPHGVLDTEMTVLSFINARTKELLVNIVHYGCHGTAAGFDTDITRDWSGYMTDRLEELTGAPAFYVNGAEGDVGPRISNGRSVGNMSHVRELGSMAAIDAVRAFKKIKEYRYVDFKQANGTIRLPYKPLPDLETLEVKFRTYTNPDELEGYHIRDYNTTKKRIEILKSGEKPETHFEFEQVIFSFNSVAVVPFPFEMFTEITLRLKDYSSFEHTLGLCNANGAFGYMPAQTEICRGGYEVESFKYFNIYTLVDDVDTRIINENLRIIEKLN